MWLEMEEELDPLLLFLPSSDGGSSRSGTRPPLAAACGCRGRAEEEGGEVRRWCWWSRGGRPRKTDASTVAVASSDINSPETHRGSLIGNVSAAAHTLASK